MGQIALTTRSIRESTTSQFLIVQLQDDAFGLDISVVREIIAYAPPTPIPMVPDFVMGVINLRGQVVPVIDLARRFSRPATSIFKRSCIIILDFEDADIQQRMGVVVDAVNEVVALSEEQIETPPQFGTGLRTDFIRGMGKIDGKFIILLTMNRVLSLEEMSHLVSLGIPSDESNG